MNIIAAWWQWLGSVQIVIRWPKVERETCEDWCGEQYGASRW